MGPERRSSGSLNMLDGVRVVDLTMWAFVPSAGGVLAHWGADVIKIEGPRSPDPDAPARGDAGSGGRQLVLQALQPGQASRSPWISRATRGRDILYRLVETADVFLDQLPPQDPPGLEV